MSETTRPKQHNFVEIVAFSNSVCRHVAITAQVLKGKVPKKNFVLSIES